MQIDEDEARHILCSIKCVVFEQGGDISDHKLVKRIYKEYPAIKKEEDERELKEKLWSVDAEADPRVKAARKAMGSPPVCARGFADAMDEYEKRESQFEKVKSEVYDELLKKNGLV